MTPLTLDPLGMALLRRLSEAQEDVQAILDLPYDMRLGVAFSDAFKRLGIRDDLAREFVNHLLFIPCEGLDTRGYEHAHWKTKVTMANKIAQQALALYRKESEA